MTELSVGLKTLWQSQEQENDPVTLDEIHSMAVKFDRRTRTATIVIPAAIAASALLFGVCWARASALDVHVALALCFAGSMVTYAMAMRQLLVQRDPAESAGVFLKRRMQLQLNKARGGWLLYLAPVLPGLIACFYVAFQRSHDVLWAPVPLLAVIVPGFAFVIVSSRARARKLRTDLDELDRLMGR